jgi:imidazolonepropionase-like amidohydrolase
VKLKAFLLALPGLVCIGLLAQAWKIYRTPSYLSMTKMVIVEKLNIRAALVGATVINPATSKITSNSAIVITGDQIESIGDSDETKIPDGAQIIDCKGKFILPGYIDTHVHFFQSGDIYTRPDAVDLAPDSTATAAHP